MHDLSSRHAPNNYLENRKELVVFIAHGFSMFVKILNVKKR